MACELNSSNKNEQSQGVLECFASFFYQLENVVKCSGTLSDRLVVVRVTPHGLNWHFLCQNRDDELH